MYEPKFIYTDEMVRDLLTIDIVVPSSSSSAFPRAHDKSSPTKLASSGLTSL